MFTLGPQHLSHRHLCNFLSVIVFPYTWLLKYLVDRVGGRSSAAPVSSAGVRPGVRPDVRPDVRAAHVSSAAPKKKSFDRGGPVWPPRSNVTNDRLRGWVWGGFAPQTSSLNGLSSHLIEAAKRGRFDQMKFFFGAADDTRAARTSGRMSGRTPGRTPDVSTRRRVQRTNLKPKIKNPNPP